MYVENIPYLCDTFTSCNNAGSLSPGSDASFLTTPTHICYHNPAVGHRHGTVLFLSLFLHDL